MLEPAMVVIGYITVYIWADKVHRCKVTVQVVCNPSESCSLYKQIYEELSVHARSSGLEQTTPYILTRRLGFHCFTT